jgi:hypothetical protein
VEVDFNARCVMGHVRARVAWDVPVHLCQQFEIYDPVDGTTAVGKVMQVNEVWGSNGFSKIVHFHVDESSYSVAAV